MASHLFMVIVFPLLQELVDLSFPPRVVEMIEECRVFWGESGLLEED